MADPLSSQILSRRRSLPSNVEDFRWHLDTIENELRRLPQNLCVLLTHTPLTQEGSRYSLFEGKGHRRGRHWKSEGELPNYRLQDTSPDLFPFGVVLSRTSSLLELAVDSAERTWLNFGGKCGFYVSDATVRDSLPAGKVAHELTERTIWHYFAENTGDPDPIPDESSFESVYEQLLHCYRGIQETCMDFIDQLSTDDETTGIIEELEWPEVMLYLGLKNPGPFFSVERGSVLRSSQAEELIPWGKVEESHHVFRLRPASVARATWYALEALGCMVHAVDEPVGGAPATNVAVPANPVTQQTDTTATESDGATSTPTKAKRSTERGEGRAKLIAALTKHHKYADGSCLNLEPVGNNNLGRLVEVSESTASRFFKKEFKGHSKYRALCNNAPLLAAALKALNGEFRPHELYGARTPDEVKREMKQADE